jgi:hypothetical protein
MLDKDDHEEKLPSWGQLFSRVAAVYWRALVQWFRRWSSPRDARLWAVVAVGKWSHRLEIFADPGEARDRALRLSKKWGVSVHEISTTGLAATGAEMHPDAQFFGGSACILSRDQLVESLASILEAASWTGHALPGSLTKH